MKTLSKLITATRAMPASSLPLSVLALTLATLAAPNAVHAQKIETVALYTFSDPTSLLKDTSGKGNTLGAMTGVTQSTTEYSSAAPTAVSAYFNGAQTGGAKQINFSSYTALTFDWYMKADAEANRANTLFQSGYQSDLVGAVVIQLNWNAQADAAILKIVHRLDGSAKWAIVEFAISDPSEWKNYTLTIDNSEVTTSGHITLLLDGITQVASTSSVASGVTGSFLSAAQYSRLGSGAPTANSFKGYLQNFEIYSGTPTPVPESATTATLLGLAVISLFLVYRRRR